MASCIRYILVALVIYTVTEQCRASLFRKRQLVVGRVGFRPGRSLAIGRGALLKPSGKRSSETVQAPDSVAPTLDDLLLPTFRNTYCTAERQELADLLFANVVQAMQELKQFATICYGTDNPAEIRDHQFKPEDFVEYVTDE